MKYKVGDIIELSTDSLALYQVDSKGIKLVARGLEFLERWDMKGRQEYYLKRAREWRADNDRTNHSPEKRTEMYNQMMENYFETEESYTTTEGLENTLKEFRVLCGEPDNEEYGRIRVDNRWKFYVDKLLKYNGLWWLKSKEEKEWPDHYSVAGWSQEADDLGIDHWQFDMEEWYDMQDDFIRMINSETGEVREVKANDEGFKALLGVLVNEIKMYTEGFLKDRNIQEDVYFEGDQHYRWILEKRLRIMLKEEVK